MTDLSRTIAEYLGPWNVGPELFAGLLRAPSEAAVKLFLTHNRHSPLPPSRLYSIQQSDNEFLYPA